MQEKIILDRFEYKLPENMYKVYKESSGFIYKLKHSKKEFDSEEKVLKFIEDTLKERKRYQQLVRTLNITELKKLFSDITLLELTPAQIKEYKIIEKFQYRLISEYDGWGFGEVYNSLEEIKEIVSDKLGISFSWYLDLKDSENNTVVGRGLK